MRFLGYADIHFAHNWPEFNSVENNGQTRWLNLQIDVWKQIQDYARHYGVVAKLFAGDLVHKRSFIHTTVNNAVLNLYKFSDVPEVLIAGNHDRFSPECNAVQALDHLGKATVLPCHDHATVNYIREGDPQLVTITAATPGGPIPARPQKDGVHILLAHGLLHGASAPSGFEFTSGYSLENFTKYDLVVLGDIHKSQIHNNVLIPGSPMQLNWGDSGLHPSCWLIDTQRPARPIEQSPVWTQIGSCWARPLEIKAPKFIIVTQENIEQVVEQDTDDYNYYDFRLTHDLDTASYKELKHRFPNSYLVSRKEQKQATKVSISSKTNSPEEILAKYYDLRVKEDQKKQFVEQGLKYLFTADPKQLNRSHKNLQLRYIKAQNFMSFKEVLLDFQTLTSPLYQVTGSSDDETSTTNGIGKSVLATEILTYTLFDKLARSSSRSKDRLIHDPNHEGKAKNLLCEVGLTVEGTNYIIQRYRKHDELGTGSRILRGKA